MKEIDFILNKLRFITNSRTDKELCEILDINYSTLDTWKNNNKIPEKRLFKIYQKLSINANDLIKAQDFTIKENYGFPMINKSRNEFLYPLQKLSKGFFLFPEGVFMLKKEALVVIEQTIGYQFKD